MAGLIDIATKRLSAREQDSLEHLAERRTARVIAPNLFITPRSVERLMASMRRKLRARNTPHMIS